MLSHFKVNIRRHLHRKELLYDNHSCHHCRGTGEMKEGLLLFSGREKLFDKVITKSDIIQHRLAIPKCQARKHFLMQVGAVLCMEDINNKGKVWKFNCSFRKSSQGYVFTGDWSRFVNEKRLGIGDVVTFFRSTQPNSRLYIDCSKSQSQSSVVAEKHEAFQLFPNQKKIFKLFGVNISTQ